MSEAPGVGLGRGGGGCWALAHLLLQSLHFSHQMLLFLFLRGQRLCWGFLAPILPFPLPRDPTQAWVTEEQGWGALMAPAAPVSLEEWQSLKQDLEGRRKPGRLPLPLYSEALLLRLQERGKGEDTSVPLAQNLLSAGPGPEDCDSVPPGSWPDSSGPPAPHPQPWQTAGPAGYCVGAGTCEP